MDKLSKSQREQVECGKGVAIELVKYKKDKRLQQITGRFVLVSQKSPVKVIERYLRMRLDRAADHMDEKTPLFLFVEGENRLISRGKNGGR